MNTQYTGYLTLAVLGGMLLLLALNVSNLFTHQRSERYLSYNGVRGMALEQNRKLWTLNFDQQNQVIEHINRSLPTTQNRTTEKSPLPYDRLIIYRFKGPDLFVTPVAYEGYNLLFECKEWNPSGYLLDISAGTFDTLLKSTYDP